MPKVAAQYLELVAGVGGGVQVDGGVDAFVGVVADYSIYIGADALHTLYAQLVVLAEQVDALARVLTCAVP